jgi:hypothetical protein
MCHFDNQQTPKGPNITVRLPDLSATKLVTVPHCDDPATTTLSNRCPYCGTRYRHRHRFSSPGIGARHVRRIRVSFQALEKSCQNYSSMLSDEEELTVIGVGVTLVDTLSKLES